MTERIIKISNFSESLLHLKWKLNAHQMLMSLSIKKLFSFTRGYYLNQHMRVHIGVIHAATT
jgi:hypothetical protein